MKNFKIEQVKELYETIYWGIDPSYGGMNREEEEAIELDEELFNLIEEFELEGCDGDIDNDSDRNLTDLDLEELELLYNKLVEFQNKL
jgi:hypothetical protein